MMHKRMRWFLVCDGRRLKVEWVVMGPKPAFGNPRRGAHYV